MERLLYCHEYLQRYSNRVLNQSEYAEYDWNKFLGGTAGMALAVMVPFNVVSMMQLRYNFEYYAPRCKRLSAVTGLVSVCWVMATMR